MKFHKFHVVIFIGILFASHQITATESMKKTTYLQKVVKTAKERLGIKASDNQRVNNCKVPVGKRGAKARPDQCYRRKPNAELTSDAHSNHGLAGMSID